MTHRRTLIALGLALATLAVAASAPAATAHHICGENEPPWQCEHRRPTPQEVVDWILETVPVVDEGADAVLA